MPGLASAATSNARKPAVVTLEYVDGRFCEFVAKYTEVLKSLNFDEKEAAERVAILNQRLKTRDFRLYGNRPVHMLHAGKRITRFCIKSAIEFSPSARARKERLRHEYAAECAEARKRNPAACFFSFKATYASKLRVNLAPHKALFRL